MTLKFNFLSYLSAVIILAASCSGNNNSESASDSPAVEEHTLTSADKAITPPHQNARIPVNGIGPLREVFNDSNKYQYAHASRLGIDPITDLSKAYYTKRPIIHIRSNEYYQVDSLTHSVPFLVPEAARLLEKIGRNFIDSLHNRGGDGYTIRVTSLLRTPTTVKRLRRVNINATDSSTHQFGTTFDISYIRFNCLDPTRTIHEGDLKNLLAEVLLDLRRQNICMVKYEHKTGCFHITATQ